MHGPLPLRFSEFGSDGDPLVSLGREESRQANYLRCYLHDLGARSVVVEPNYFDRDYLLGPAARFRIDQEADGSAVLVPESPPPRRGEWPTINPTTTYHELEPTELIVAVHQDLRTDPLELQRAALTYSKWLPDAMEHEARQQGADTRTGMVVRSRFIRLRDYVEQELASALRTQPRDVLSRARLSLWEQVAPMSLHLGLVRVSLGTEPMMDLLFDTSDCDRHLRPSAFVAFHPQVPWLLERWNRATGKTRDLGVLVRAW
jgi:hypothetical protein